MRTRLNRVLNNAVSYALLGSATACGAQAMVEPGDGTTQPTGTPAPIATSVGPDNAPTTMACLPEGESSFTHMQLSTGYDYIARRQAFRGDSSGQESDQAGSACSGASDQQRCLRALELAWPSERSEWNECVQICVAFGVVVTQGDEVRLLDNVASLKQLLGVIDTPYEAALLAEASGFSPRCGETRIAQKAGGYSLVTTEMVESCPIAYDEVNLEVAGNGALEEGAHRRVTRDGTGACVGRRPEGLVSSGASADSPARGARCTEASVGHFFANVAELEQSAVEAFRVIAEELTALGAPPRLQRAARRAAEDEVRHTALTARLARRYGAEPSQPRITDKPLRPLFELALDNVIEGCVRETYGAACAKYQAMASIDPEVRSELSGVARDEARHAELSWQIHAWACGQLRAGEVESLRLATRTAIDELRREVADEPELAVRHFAGMPSAQHALAMLDSLEAQLWSGAALGVA